MDAEQGLPLPQRYWAIVVVALGITLAVLDSAIANVALPTIARDLRASAASSIWIVNAYQLAVTISLLPLASLGDRIGYGFGMVCIRSSAGQCLFKSVSGSALPQWKVLPEKIVESPYQSGSDRRKRFKVNPLAGSCRGVCHVAQRVDEFFFHRIKR